MPPTPQQSLGRRGEALAAQYLLAKGYSLLERNWRCPHGEIDLIMRDGQETVFVEVRTRRAPDTNTAIESVTSGKQARMTAAVETYIESNAWDDAVPWRIDLVVIAITPAGPQIEVIHDAISW